MRRTATKNRLFEYLPKKTFTTRNQAKPGTVFRLRQLKNPVSSSGQGKPGESHHLPESTEPIDGLLAIKSVRRKQRRRKFRPIDRIGIPLTDDGDPFVIPVAAARLRFGASAAQAFAGVERHAGLRRENLHPASRTCIAQFADFGQDILPPTVHGEEVVVPPQHPDPVEIGIDALTQAAQ